MKKDVQVSFEEGAIEAEEILGSTTPIEVTSPGLVNIKISSDEERRELSTVIATLIAQANYNRSDTLEKLKETIRRLQKCVSFSKKSPE